MKVLVVDDSPLIRERLLALISTVPGAEAIGSAANGREAMEMTESLHPDLVTLDLHMKGGNGFEYLDRIHTLGPDAPQVVVLTNYFDEPYRRRCLALGAVAFLDKSRQFSELPELIGRLRKAPRDFRRGDPGGAS